MGVKDASQIPAREPFEEPARRRVALGLLMSQIVQAEQIKLDRERVQTRLGDLVAGYPEPQQEEARRAYLQNQDAMRQIESAALEDQVVEWVLGRANITDKPMTFKEITGFGQEQAA
jgi:trigger factor